MNDSLPPLLPECEPRSSILEVSLQSSESALSGALSAARVGLWGWDLKTQQISYSTGIEKGLDLPLERLPGFARALLRLLQPQDRRMLIRTIAQALHEKAPFETDFRMICRDQSLQWINIRGHVWQDETGKLLGLTGVCLNITERKQAEIQAQLHSLLLNTVEQFVIATTPEGTILYWNQFAEKLYGWTATEAIGQNLKQLVVAQVSPEQIAEIKARTQAGQSWSGEFRVQHRDGTVLPIGVTTAPLYDERQSLIGVIGVGVDISERKMLEAALRRANAELGLVVEEQTHALQDTVERLHQEIAFRQQVEAQNTLLATAIEAAGDAIEIIDAEGRLEYVNAAFESITGYSRSEAIGHKPESLLQGCNQDPTFQQDLWKTLTAGQMWRGHVTSLRRDQSLLYQEMTVSPVPDKTGKPKYFVGVRRDITDRKKSEEEAQRQTLRLQLLSEITLKIRGSLQLTDILETTVQEVRKLLQVDRVLIYRLFQDGSGAVVNEAVTPGCSAILEQNIVDECFREAYTRLYPQGRIRAISDLSSAEISPCHAEFLHQFGVQANLVVPILERDGLWGLLIAHQCSGVRSWSQFEIELLQQLADQVGFALSQAQLLENLRTSEAEVLNALAKERELNELKSRFVSMVSHEFRTPLATILAATNLLKLFSEKLSEAHKQERLQKIQIEVCNMTQLLEDVLFINQAEAGRLSFNPVPLDLAELCQTFLDEVQFINGKTHLYCFEPGGDVGQVEVDRKLMRQIVMNLISNATKYSPEGSEIRMQLNREGKCVVLTVQDQGIGIPCESQANLFQDFYRASNVGNISGTGLGLSIVRQAVELHSGKIKVDSEVGVGTTFTIQIPVQQNKGVL